MYLLQIVKRAPHANRDLGWRVAFIKLEVGVDGYLVHAHLLVELNVDEMGLRPIGPVSHMGTQQCGALGGPHGG